MWYRGFILALWVTSFAAWASAAEIQTDSSHYAVVTSISVHSNAGPGEFTLVITGEIQDRCSQLKRVDVIYSPGLIEVFPLMQMTEYDNIRCGLLRVPFSYAQLLSIDPGDEALIYVYRRNGPPLQARVVAGEMLELTESQS